MECQQEQVQDIEIEENSSIPAPVIKLPVTPRRKRSVPYLQKVEDVEIKNVLRRHVVSAISKSLSNKEQEDAQNHLQEQESI